MRVKKPKGLTLEEWIKKLEAEKEAKVNKAVEKVRRSIETSYNARIEYLKQFGLRELPTLRDKAESLYDYRKIYYRLYGMSEEGAEAHARSYAERWLNAMRA